MSEFEKATIAKFDADLTAFWPQVEAFVSGMLFQQAAVIVKSPGGPFIKWLDDRMTRGDMIAANPFNGAACGHCPEYLIVCDQTNNPPHAVAEGKMFVKLNFKLFGKSWGREFEIKPKTILVVD